MKEKHARLCETCNKRFRPMGDAQWRIVKFEHDLMSLRHPQEVRARFRAEWEATRAGS